MSSNTRTARGFTMIELIVVVSIIAILGSIAAPSFIATLATQRLRNASFDLVSDLLLARGEAAVHPDELHQIHDRSLPIQFLRIFLR